MEAVTEKRLFSLDVLRGIAISGILLVNGPTLNSPVPMDGTDFAQKVGTVNIWYGNFILNFAAGYFYPIFAMLFAVSAAIFLSKPDTKNRNALFARRLLALLFFGLLQVLFIWWGDVLIVDALFGFTLIPLASLAPKKLWYLLGGVIVTAITLSTISWA